MLAIMFIISFLGLYIKKSKAFEMIQIVWIWIILALCVSKERFDYQNYVFAYSLRTTSDMIKSQKGEIGYAAINYVGNWFGLSFDTFNAIIIICSLAIMYKVVHKYVDNACIIWSLYMIFPMLDNGIQIRNTIAFSIVLLGLKYILNAKEYRNWGIRYAVYILIASTFHKSVLIYLIFVIAPMLKRHNIKKIVFICATIILAFGTSIFILFSNLIDQSRVATYLSSENQQVSTSVGILICIWHMVIYALIIFLNHTKITHWKITANKNVELLYWEDMVEKMNICLLIVLPLYFYTFTYTRVIRYFLIINYMFFASYMQKRKANNEDNKKYNIKQIIVIIFIVVTFVGMDILLNNNFEFLFSPYYFNNFFSLKM